MCRVSRVLAVVEQHMTSDHSTTDHMTSPKNFSLSRAAKSLPTSARVDYAKRMRGVVRLSSRGRRKRRAAPHRWTSRAFLCSANSPRLSSIRTRRTYLAARDAVLRLSPLPIAATDLAELERLLDQGEAQAVLDRLDALPPSKVLSPRVHFLAAEAAEMLGDAAAVELERSLFVLTLQGLLATGDGSPRQSLLVCHATDEYDLLEVAGPRARRPIAGRARGRLHDVLICSDGRRDLVRHHGDSGCGRSRESGAARARGCPHPSPPRQPRAALTIVA